MSRTHQVKRSELQYWEKVPIDAMSEESDGEGETIVKHQPMHGDQSVYGIMCMHACMLCYVLMHAGLNKFIKKLDQCNEKNTKTCPHKKVRVAAWMWFTLHDTNRITSLDGQQRKRFVTKYIQVTIYNIFIVHLA